MDGWMDGWMDGRMDGWMDGWKGRKCEASAAPCQTCGASSFWTLPQDRPVRQASGTELWDPLPDKSPPLETASAVRQSAAAIQQGARRHLRGGGAPRPRSACLRLRLGGVCGVCGCRRRLWPGTRRPCGSPVAAALAAAVAAAAPAAVPCLPRRLPRVTETVAAPAPLCTRCRHRSAASSRPRRAARAAARPSCSERPRSVRTGAPPPPTINTFPSLSGAFGFPWGEGSTPGKLSPCVRKEPRKGSGARGARRPARSVNEDRPRSLATTRRTETKLGIQGRPTLDSWQAAWPQGRSKRRPQLAHSTPDIPIPTHRRWTTVRARARGHAHAAQDVPRPPSNASPSSPKRVIARARHRT
eukprot:364185-Chlamydomonas_euryale.AAC.1